MSVQTKIFTVNAGNPVFVPTGITRPSVLLVIRSGKVHKKTTSIDPGFLEWIWFIGRIKFKTEVQFEQGEKITVLYKV